MWLAFFLALCNLTAFKANLMLASLHALALGLGPIASGTLFATFAVAPIVLGMYAGRLSDSVGTRLPMLWGSLGMAVALFLPWLLPNVWGLFLSAALLGAAYVFYHVAVQTYVGACSTPKTRARNFANYSLVITLPYLVGPPLIGTLIEQVGYGAASLILGLLSVIAAVVLLGKRRGFSEVVRVAPNRGIPVSEHLTRNKPLLYMALTSGLALTSVDIFQFFAPVHAKGAGLTPPEIGMVLSMYAVAAISVRVVLPWLITLCGGEERLLMIALAAATVAYLAFPLFGSIWALGGMALLLGAGLGCAQTVSLLLTYNYAAAGRAGEGLGFRLFVNNAAHLALPFVLGIVSSTFGLLVVFWANAGILVGGAWMTARGAAARANECLAAELPTMPTHEGSGHQTGRVKHISGGEAVDGSPKEGR